MSDVDPAVWYANRADPFDRLLRSGVPLVACSLLPVIGVLCATGAAGVPGPLLLLVSSLVPIAVVSAAVEFFLDRRAVVEMRLAGGELTVVRTNRTTATYPVREVRRIEVVRGTHGIQSWSLMRLHVGEDRVERTRPGAPDLPSRWTEAMNIAEIPVDTREKRYRDD